MDAARWMEVAARAKIRQKEECQHSDVLRRLFFTLLEYWGCRPHGGLSVPRHSGHRWDYERPRNNVLDTILASRKRIIATNHAQFTIRKYNS